MTQMQMRSRLPRLSVEFISRESMTKDRLTYRVAVVKTVMFSMGITQGKRGSLTASSARYMFAYACMSGEFLARVRKVTYNNYGSRLHKHVIARRRDGSRPDTIRISRRPSNLDRVHIRVTNNERHLLPTSELVLLSRKGQGRETHDGEVNPWRGRRVECV